MDVPLRQRPLSLSIDLASFDELIVCSQDDRSRALALSTALPHAGDWLNVVPSKDLGLHLHDLEFRLCLQYWLGLRMVEEGAVCPVCQRVTDPYGDHQIGCGGNGDRIHRHDSIRDAVFSAAQSAALAPRKEFPALIPGSSSRPADVYLPNWKRGQPAALDVTVISTFQSLTLSGAAVTPGYALSVAAERKRAAHASACHSVGVSFTRSLLGDGTLKPSPPSRPLAASRAYASAFLLRSPPGTCSSELPFVFGGVMPLCGLVDSPSTPRK